MLIIIQLILHFVVILFLRYYSQRINKESKKHLEIRMGRKEIPSPYKTKPTVPKKVAVSSRVVLVGESGL